MISEIIEAVFKAAVPIGALGYLLMYWSIKSGRLSGDGDGVMAMRTELKAMKREQKAARKSAKKSAKEEKRAAKLEAKLAAKEARKKGQKSVKEKAPRDWSGLGARAGGKLIGRLKPTGNPLHDKWMKFGGGFYGVVALWTYVVIELQEIYQFLMAFTGLSGIADLLSLDLLIGFLINSIVNFVLAITWFAYWPEVLNSERILLWLIVAYGGYLGGLQLARRRWPPRLWR